MDAGDDLSDPITLVTDPAKSVNNPNNPTIAAGFTFLGQFLDRAKRSLRRAAPLPRGTTMKWPHPYHGSAAHRRAIRRLRSSHHTVAVAVMGSL
jgi:hypothetical protein